MANNTTPHLKDPEFWARMERVSERVRKWPQWMKGSPVNRREPQKTTAAPKKTIKASRAR